MSQWKLYEIDQLLRDAYNAADAAINHDTGEVPPDWAKFLDDVQGERDEKALNVAAMIRELKAEAEAITTERKRLQAREKAAENKADALKSYLSAFVRPGEKIKDNRVSIGWSHRQSVVVDDPAVVPDDYCKIERTPQLTLIKDAIANGGVVVPGARIVDNQFITIR